MKEKIPFRPERAVGTPEKEILRDTQNIFHRIQDHLNGTIFLDTRGRKKEVLIHQAPFIRKYPVKLGAKLFSRALEQRVFNLIINIKTLDTNKFYSTANTKENSRNKISKLLKRIIPQKRPPVFKLEITEEGNKFVVTLTDIS